MINGARNKELRRHEDIWQTYSLDNISVVNGRVGCISELHTGRWTCQNLFNINLVNDVLNNACRVLTVKRALPSMPVPFGLDVSLRFKIDSCLL